MARGDWETRGIRKRRDPLYSLFPPVRLRQGFGGTLSLIEPTPSEIGASVTGLH
jgi:hypothetical protein